MDFIKEPMDIENKSMEIIAPHLAALHLSEAETKVYSRMIHASGDVEYAPFIRLHPEAIKAAQEALQKGCNIYTDVEMVRTGIHKASFNRYGGKIECRVADPEIADIAKKEGITRSMAAMRAFGKALASPQAQQRFAAIWAEPLPTTPEQFGELAERERSRYQGIVKLSGARVD